MLPYIFKHSRRARRLRITVRPPAGLAGCDANVVVTVPYFFPQSKVEKFLLEKSRWIFRKVKYFQKLGQVTRVGGGVGEYKKLKHLAHELIKEKIIYLNKIYNFSFNRVCVKNHKSRWGSCSKKGNLNFNYRVIHLPAELAEYIVAHELCHLKEMNHSGRFWALLAKAIPDYQNRRKKLKMTRI